MEQKRRDNVYYCINLIGVPFRTWLDPKIRTMSRFYWITVDLIYFNNDKNKHFFDEYRSISSSYVNNNKNNKH